MRASPAAHGEFSKVLEKVDTFKVYWHASESGSARRVLAPREPAPFLGLTDRSSALQKSMHLATSLLCTSDHACDIQFSIFSSAKKVHRETRRRCNSKEKEVQGGAPRLHRDRRQCNVKEKAVHGRCTTIEARKKKAFQHERESRTGALTLHRKK
jgi:hypothetical protein